MTDPGGARTPTVARLAMAWLVVLPLGQMLVVPVRGAAATATDLALLALLIGALFALVGRVAGRERTGGNHLLGRDYRISLTLLGGFAVWMAASGLWGFHPGYALTKGAGLAALALGALALATCGAGAARLADAWLGGTAAALAVTLLCAALGPPFLRDRVLYGAGMVEGLPFPRVRGTFVHPTLFGDYLAVSGALLWARWPAWKAGGARGAAMALAAGVAMALVMTASTAWLAAGGALAALAVVAPAWTRGARLLVGLAGAALALVTLVGVAFPVDVPLGPWRVATGAIRPEIWADGVRAVAESPLLGVGAAPYLAVTENPAGPPGATSLWDAHSTYLSVLGQLGPVGAMLFFGGMALAARSAVRAGGGDATGTGRLRVAILAVAAGATLHWTSVAGEEFRHLWALVGVVGAMPPGGGGSR